jgi:hypothetical protein
MILLFTATSPSKLDMHMNFSQQEVQTPIYHHKPFTMEVRYQGRILDPATFDFSILTWKEFKEWEKLNKDITEKAKGAKALARAINKLDTATRFARDFKSLLQRRFRDPDSLSKVRIGEYLILIHSIPESILKDVPTTFHPKLALHAASRWEALKKGILERSSAALDTLTYQRLTSEVHAWEEEQSQ